MENTKCDRLEICGFFQEFQGNSEVIKEAWLISYCNDLDSSNTCMRKKYFNEHGVAPAINMSPTGRML